MVELEMDEVDEKRQCDDWHCLQQSPQVSGQEIFHRNATATDQKSLLGLEQLFLRKEFSNYLVFKE